MSRQERSGWRDEAISRRHRLWGVNCPAADLDSWIVCEYDQKKVVALIEYKEHSAQLVYRNDPNRAALEDLAGRAKLPLFGVRYRKNASGDGLWRGCYDWSFTATAANGLGRNLLGDTQRGDFNEESFIAFLYRLRGRDPPTQIELAGWRNGK